MASTIPALDTPEFQSLREVLKSRQTILMVGAGLSCPLHYPSWTSLLKELGDIARLKASKAQLDLLNSFENDKSCDVLVWAELLTEILEKNEYQTLVADRFKPGSIRFTHLHRQLASLPFKHVLTTNYDTALEDAHQDIGFSPIESCTLRSSHALASITKEQIMPLRHILHVHGIYSDPESIILSLKNYQNVYQTSRSWTDVLKSLALTNSFIFVGFSLTDLNFMNSFLITEAITKSESPRHFAFWNRSDKPLDDSRAQYEFAKKYGISLVLYGTPHNHGELNAIADALVDETQKNIRDAAPGLSSDSIQNKDLAVLSRIVPLTESLKSSKYSLELYSEESKNTPVDREIENAFLIAKHGNTNEARKLYQEILVREPNLNNRLRFRVWANLGNTHYMEGDFSSAAVAYRKAYDQYPDFEDAKVQLAFAYYLEGNEADAAVLLNEICGRSPENEKAQGIRVRCQPPTTTLRELKRTIPRKIRKKADILFGLATHAKKIGNQQREEAYLRQSHRIDPGWIEIGLALTSCLLQRVKNELGLNLLIEQSGAQSKYVTEAQNILTSLLNNPSLNSNKLKSNLYYNRSTAHRILQNHEKAKKDLETAYHLNPTDMQIACSYAAWLYDGGKFDDSINILKINYKLDKQPSTAFLFADSLASRCKDNDLAEALSILDEQRGVFTRSDINPEEEFEFHNAYASILQKQTNAEEARKYLRELTPKNFPPGAKDILQLRQMLSMQNEETSSQCLEIYNSIDSTQLKKNEYFHLQLARIAERMHDYKTAFEFWRTRLSSDKLYPTTKSALYLAFNAREYRYIVNFGENLRRAGNFDDVIIRLEVDSLLQLREFSKAITLLNHRCKQNQSSKLLPLFLVHLSQIHGVPVDSSLTNRLPQASEVENSSQGAILVRVLQQLNRYTEARKIGYEIWHRFPGEPNAIRACFSALLHQPADQIPAPLTQVNGNCAVTLKRKDDQANIQTFYLESDLPPNVGFKEYLPTSSIGMILANKKIGDVVTLNSSEWIVHQVEDKASARLRAYFENLDSTPEIDFIRQFSVPAHPPQGARTTKELLGQEMTNFLDQGEARDTEIRAHYFQKKIPIHVVAKLSDESTFTTIAKMGISGGGEIVCCEGDDASRNNVSNHLKSAKSIIIDSTAIGTLFLIEKFPVLSTLNCSIVTTESSLHEIVQFKTEHTHPEGWQGGYLNYRNGKPLYSPSSLSEENRLASQANELLIRLRTETQSVGGTALSELDEKEQDQLEEVFGPGTADVVAYALKHQALIWTDDLFFAQYCKYRYKLKTAWTQAVLYYCVEKGLFPKQDYVTAIASLIQHRYNSVYLTIDVIIHCLTADNWRCKSRESVITLNYLVKSMIKVPGNRHVFMLLLGRIWSLSDDGRQSAVRLRTFLNTFKDPSEPKKAIKLYLRAFQKIRMHGFARSRTFERVLHNWFYNHQNKNNR